MAFSSCVKCGSRNFELSEGEPNGSSKKFWYLQCTQCGGVAGMTEFFNAGTLLNKQAAEISALSKSMQEVKYALGNLEALVRRLK